MSIEDRPETGPSLSIQPIPAAHRAARGSSVSDVRVSLLRIAAPCLVALHIDAALKVPNGMIHRIVQSLGQRRTSTHGDRSISCPVAHRMQEPQKVAAHLEKRCVRRKHWAQQRVARSGDDQVNQFLDVIVAVFDTDWRRPSQRDYQFLADRHHPPVRAEPIVGGWHNLRSATLMFPAV